LALEDRLEDCCALELHCISLIARGRCNVELDGVQYLGFVVVRITLRHAFHGLEIGEDAGAMVDFVIIRIERRQRIDEVALAWSLRADRLGLLDCRNAKWQVFDGRRRMWIVEEAQRNTPIGDAAVPVGLEYFLE
jgi:hypothetical protein